MQTFVPFPDFAPLAAVLDDKRLGKRVEADDRARFEPDRPDDLDDV